MKENAELRDKKANAKERPPKYHPRLRLFETTSKSSILELQTNLGRNGMLLGQFSEVDGLVGASRAAYSDISVLLRKGWDMDMLCNAIVEAHQTPLKVEMTDESKEAMEEGRDKMLQREEELFKNHEAAIGKSVQTLETKFKNVVDGFKGVWVDKKTFNRYYWGFIGLLETTVCALSLVLYYWVKFGAPWNC